ncbi:GNAT family N-acetyltransferase [Terrabacter sp. BE26]|uniref:GNAT family N-acetyltransferase n=1 Tax=Terrabacter sp. BE26 TaxID=2898152 RepID=UPI0035BE739F
MSTEPSTGPSTEPSAQTSTQASTELRVISSDDWEAFRAVRLRALADSPDSFRATLDAAAAHAPSVWRDRAAGPGPLVLAFSGSDPIGMGGLYTPDASGEAFLWGMWVEPASRGRGVAAGVLERLLEHADDQGCHVVLHVTEGNETARRLYERHGFTATGEVLPLRDGSCVRISTMRRACPR